MKASTKLGKRRVDARDESAQEAGGGAAGRANSIKVNRIDRFALDAARSFDDVATHAVDVGGQAEQRDGRSRTDHDDIGRSRS